MYENYTRQSLPAKRYREILGSAICVFNSNNAFLIENILRYDDTGKYDWWHLIDLESGKLKGSIYHVISSRYGDEIEKLFINIVNMRNRIIHSFPITDENGECILATKEKIKDGNHQFRITEDYLLNFIELNQQLSDKLHKLRGY
ncbi:MAG: selenium binding protein [Eubacteriales bacterium]|jgi:hypothetical protein